QTNKHKNYLLQFYDYFSQMYKF
ncbi:MAG: hypothetical protein RL742_154, partial [Bacteroidota bacterium]